MARKRKHSSSIPPQTPPPLPSTMPPTKSSTPSSLSCMDFDSDSPLGSPDSSGASSACSPCSSSAGKSEKSPMVRSAANARERSRMRVLSKAFSKLKTTLPWVPADTKLSKLDTLRLASCYIAHLREILAEDKPLSDDPSPPVPGAKRAAVKPVGAGGKKGGNSGPAPIHPLSLTWPFTFNGRVSLSSSSINDVMTSRQKDSLHTNSSKTPIAGSS